MDNFHLSFYGINKIFKKILSRFDIKVKIMHRLIQFDV